MPNMWDQISPDDFFRRMAAAQGGGGGGDPPNWDLVQTSGNQLAQKLVQYGLQTDQGAKTFGLGLSTFNTKFNDGARFFNKTMKETGSAFTAELLAGSKTVQEVTAEFEKTRQAIEANNDLEVHQKELYIQQVKAMEDWVQKDTIVQFKQKQMAENADKIKKGFDALDSTVLKMVKTYQGSSDGLSTATNMAQTGISLAGSTAEKAGGLMQKAAPALAMLGPAGMIAAAGLSVIGTVVGAAGAAMREIAEKAMPIMNAQIQAMSKSYMDATSTGALFGGGMSEMIKTSADAGISMGTFSNIIKNNASDLAKSGLGIAEGAKQVAGVGKIMRDNGTTDQLLKFGISLEEQGGLVAQTVARMRAGGGGAVDQTKVAEATAKYAKDLKTLGDLTGEDVKSKEKAAKEASNNLAFQIELAGMAPDARDKIQAAMVSMNDIERKAFVERMINRGELMSEETNMMASQSDAYNKKTKQMYDEALSGKLDFGRQIEINTEYGESMKKDMLGMKDLAFAAVAGVDSVAGIAKNAVSLLSDSLTQTPEALAAALAARQKLDKTVAEGGDPITTKFAEIVKEGEALRGKLDQLVGTGGAMTLYLDAVKLSTTTMLDVVKKFTGEETSGEAKARTEQEARNKKDREQIGGQLGAAAKGGPAISSGNMISRFLGADDQTNMRSKLATFDPQQIEAMAKDQGVSVEDLLKTVGVKNIDELKKIREQEDSLLKGRTRVGKFAEGGLASGSMDGFIAQLHGTEAVLPLDNPATMAKIRDSLFGGSANSVMNPESEEAMMATQSAAFAEKTKQMFAEVMKGSELDRVTADASSALQERMTQVMERGFADMVKVMSDIAYHTENTSVRVA